MDVMESGDNEKQYQIYQGKSGLSWSRFNTSAHTMRNRQLHAFH